MNVAIKSILLVILSLLFQIEGVKAAGLIQIETNKITCLINFLETAANQIGTSSSFRSYINAKAKDNREFIDLVHRYEALNLNDQFRKQEFPSSRNAYRSTKDLIWIASAHSNNLSDFSQRIIGLLPHYAHVELISILKDITTFYDDWIWREQQKNIKRIGAQLNEYTEEIENIFLKVSQFYGTNWNKDIPFIISLYPIPLETGNVTAVPKGNTLICGFLAESKSDFKGTLGVIIHEICHILYDEQPASLQHQIDQWIQQSTSPFARLTYQYLNEGLATAIGNGWAYEQFIGKMDTSAWYNDPYIDGFAHAIYEDISLYLSEKKQLNQAFIAIAIRAFKKTFPHAIYDPIILMNEVHLFANAEEKSSIDLINATIRKYFRISSMYFSSPISSTESEELLKKNQTTKVIIIDSNHQATLTKLIEAFPNMQNNLIANQNFVYSFRDSLSNSPIIIINILSLNDLDPALSMISRMEQVKFGALKVIN